MEQKDALNEAMNTFLKQLPDPQLNNSSTIIGEFTVLEQKVSFMAQKVKGKLGMSWKIEPMKWTSQQL
jgi:hypothetical protein